jgi:hypothetical protein
MSFAKFQREFKLSVKKAIKASEKAIQKSASQLFMSIIIDTPVGDVALWKYAPKTTYKPGQLRGNWQTSINSQATDKISREQLGTSGPASKEAQSQASKFKIDSTIYLANNSDYGTRVEDGWSKQAPAGMVKVNVMKFDSILQKNIRKYKT